MSPESIDLASQLRSLILLACTVVGACNVGMTLFNISRKAVNEASV